MSVRFVSAALTVALVIVAACRDTSGEGFGTYEVDFEGGNGSGGSGSTTSGSASGVSAGSGSGSALSASTGTAVSGNSTTGVSGSPSGSSGTGSGSQASGSKSGTTTSGTSTSDDAGAPMLGVKNCPAPCDLRTNTCCVAEDGGETCLNQVGAQCGANTASIHCSGVSDCQSGQICCGVYNIAQGSITLETQCQAAPCSIAQFCETDPECANGMPCVTQKCGSSTGTLQLCGVQSKAPFNCTAAQ